MLHDLKHYLPAQAPLKDFIHHNTLHAFQHLKFFPALWRASNIFGYKVTLSLEEYRALYTDAKISEATLNRIIIERFGKEQLNDWKNKLLSKRYDLNCESRIGKLRSNWETLYNVDLDVLVHPPLFRILCSYLDQGISIWNFPVHHKGFLNSVRELEKTSFVSIFKTKRAKDLLNSLCKISDLLKIIVGDESYYKQYLFDQQFAHQGWSGIVSTVEDFPETLLDRKKISLKDFIILELLFEIDAMDNRFGEIWAPLAHKLNNKQFALFEDVPETEYHTALSLFQSAYEWTYYDEVLVAIQSTGITNKTTGTKSFQAMFCIDDRETSLRDYLEKNDPGCETFTTPGFFNTEFYFQPEHGKSYTKQCPAPVMPKYLIKEINSANNRQKDVHLSSHSHSLFKGWVMAPTLGFFSAFRLFLSIFKPSMSPATSSSFSHMGKDSQLSILHEDTPVKENDLQVGFTIDEMSVRVEGLLKSIGLIENFAPLIYVIGHGSSSANNPHYAAYNCGACCGRPGSVNARVFAFMANHPEVRSILHSKNIHITQGTHFLGGLHDTTRDEIMFYDEHLLAEDHKEIHEKNILTFKNSLDLNAKERARRFELINSKKSAEKIHKKILTRSVSLFEPRPELNHATNSLCIVGSRDLTKKIFLDRRAFTNSYDYRIDPDGAILTNIMKPLGPVCGGINLEYYFSRVDNQKLGAGTKLPHNVMGLFGVANGFDGDLRPGLPAQMIELHDPVRLIIIVEHFPEVVLKTIQSDYSMFEWYKNEWIHLVSLDPQTKKFFVLKEETFIPYQPTTKNIEIKKDLTHLFETSKGNLPVFILE